MRLIPTAEKALHMNSLLKNEKRIDEIILFQDRK